MIERDLSPDGQLFLEPEIELNTFWTNLGESDQDIIDLYHAHGECEQFHSEIKTDMGVERLPSGKFDTNELVLELTMIAYNILRMLGQETVNQGKAPAKRIVSRKRIRTVIQNIIHFAGQLTKHARQLFLSISRSNVRAYVFLGLARRFASYRRQERECNEAKNVAKNNLISCQIKKLNFERRIQDIQQAIRKICFTEYE